MSVSAVSNITPVDPKREMQAIQQPPAVREAEHGGDKAQPPTQEHHARTSHHKVDVRA